MQHDFYISWATWKRYQQISWVCKLATYVWRTSWDSAMNCTAERKGREGSPGDSGCTYAIFEQGSSSGLCDVRMSETADDRQAQV
jgi:hypothetical protein